MRTRSAFVRSHHPHVGGTLPTTAILRTNSQSWRIEANERKANGKPITLLGIRSTTRPGLEPGMPGPKPGVLPITPPGIQSAPHLGPMARVPIPCCDNDPVIRSVAAYVDHARGLSFLLRAESPLSPSGRSPGRVGSNRMTRSAQVSSGRFKIVNWTHPVNQQPVLRQAQTGHNPNLPLFAPDSGLRYVDPALPPKSISTATTVGGIS